ncbi:MAG: aquaporin [Acidobacteriota bacterium]
MRAKFIAELVGTFFLALTVVLTVSPEGAGSLAPIAVGLLLAGVIFAGGHLSAAHYNPAITLAFWARGRCSRREVPVYLAAQLLGAAAAAFVADALRAGFPEPAVASYRAGPALLAEVLFTFVLAWVILNVATTRGTAGNPFYGMAIGATVTAAAYAVGPLSGAVLNPAVALALALSGLHGWGGLWIYLVATPAGALAAAAVLGLSVED